METSLTMRNAFLSAVVAAVLVFASTGQASGFRLAGQGARAAGMGGAVTALTDDASSIYFNPAGIAGRKGFDFSAGINLVMPSVTFQSDATGTKTNTEAHVATPFNVYASWGITEDLAIGLGVNTPFGAGNTWPPTWEGAGRALSSNVQAFNFNPVVAWRIHPRFKVAGGLQITRGTVLIERGLNFVDSQGKVTLGGAATGLGWNAGAQLEVVEKYLWLGATWRSSVPMAFKGSAHFSDVPASFQTLLVDQNITSNITLPDVATVGLGLRATNALRFGFDLNVVTWGSFHDLTIAFTNPDLTNPLPKNWSDTVSMHLGGEYDLNDLFSARLGLIYDPTGTPTSTLTPDLPDFTRFSVTAGLSWHSTFGLGADLAYQFVALFSQKSTAPGFSGTYSGTAQVIGLNLNYRL